MPHEPMPPEPIDGRRTATEPTGDPRCAPLTTPPAATHRHHAPDATHLLFLRAASRMPHEPKPPEPIDGRRTAMEPTDDLAHAPPTTPPAATHRARAAHHTARRHAPSPRPRRDPPFCSSELPHECLTCPCRPSQSRGDAPRRAHRRSGARANHTARRHAPSPRPRRDPHVHLREDETTHGGGAPDEPPPHARPSDRRADAPVHSAAPVAAPRPCSAPVCRRSAERR
jgi:hypothetical protein